MLDKNTEIIDLNWETFKKENNNSDMFYDIIEAMNELEENKKLSYLEKVLHEIREIDFSKNKKSIDVIWNKMQEEAAKIDTEDLNWWDKFFIDRGTDYKIRNILSEMDKIDKTGEDKNIEKIQKLIDKLNRDIYEYDINILKRRLRILEKRIDRRVSDSFGSILASLREQRGLSLAKLGDLAGVSASYINRIELNKRKAPSYPIIEKLAKALNVNINTLLVAAGATLEKAESKSIRELVFSNNVSLTEDGDALSLDKKEKLIKIIDFISEMEWKESKHIESLELFDLIDEYKKTN